MIAFEKTINGIKGCALYTEYELNNIFLPLLEQLTRIQKEKDRRVICILAAPPGAGKSTLVEFLQTISEDPAAYGSDGERVKSLQCIGMDGFHRYQEDLLSHTTMRDGKEIPLTEIKGAPMTFRLKELAEKMKLLKTEKEVLWPIYDRMLHDPVEDVIRVTSDIVLLEGNYLLLDEEGWRDLAALADYSIFLTEDEDVLRKRLVERKLTTSGSLEVAKAFVENSDMRNAKLVLEKSMPADLTIRLSAGK